MRPGSTQALLLPVVLVVLPGAAGCCQVLPGAARCAWCWERDER